LDSVVTNLRPAVNRARIASISLDSIGIAGESRIQPADLRDQIRARRFKRREIASELRLAVMNLDLESSG
jgi:hypothetical protein